ncbi:MAG: phosphate ABC transporter permease PstA [Candidatus Eremiobacteraeota bacterium]|nr:phosphate ABC transporter permease PstA [Candidatus Eremiobacteraeota bacterium]MBV8432840.1 phosphate ABC transporter permease PstA [Candidatus Eremiobacteraeota bacterium]
MMAVAENAPRPRSYGLAIRHAISFFGTALTAVCASIGAICLLIILGYVAVQGIGAVNWTFLTSLPAPVGEPGGGIGNGIIGTGITVGLATLLAAPIGLACGLYLALFGRGWFPEAVRFLSDVLSGIPSIAIGLFAYVVLVAPFHHFSAVSAAFAFALLMLPIILRTSEEAVRSVPRTMREAALALGLSEFVTTMRIVVPAARPAIITGLLLSIARVTGETAPLLFTAFGSPLWENNPLNPMAQLPLQVYNYAISPYKSWHQQAWGGALVLILAVLVLNVLARAVLSSRWRR